MEPFTVEVPDAALDDLRARIRATRWPSRETVSDWSQGVPLAFLRDLAGYWADGYDWRHLERRVNAVPNLIVDAQGIRVHALHARSSRPDAVPLVLTHGWPGGVIEFLRVIPLLTEPDDPTAPAFHVVAPSLPGYGFSEIPAEPGWGIERIADAWAALMSRLGYDRFLAAGGDWGTSVSTMIGIRHPDRVLGLHLTPPLVAPDLTDPGSWTDEERAAVAALDDRSGSAYGEVHATRPQTIGYAISDSPVGLAAWMVEKLVAWTDHDPADPFGALSRDDMLDLVSWYWFTGTSASSIRLYWESIRTVEGWFRDGTTDAVTVPTGAAVFRDLPRPSRRWVERRFRDLRFWAEPDRGGHFAAFEQPERYAEALRGSAAAILGSGAA